MNKYVALLRGIMPTNPNMRNDKLCKVFEELGLKNPRAVISSGNVVFESDSNDVKALEELIEKAWPEKLGFNSTTIIRSKEDLEKLVNKKPFGDKDHNQKEYLIVTFLKEHNSKLKTFPKSGIRFSIPAVYKTEICAVIDLENTKTPDVMRMFEKEFGKEITTRTFKTVERILKVMS